VQASRRGSDATLKTQQSITFLPNLMTHPVRRSKHTNGRLGDNLTASTLTAVTDSRTRYGTATTRLGQRRHRVSNLYTRRTSRQNQHPPRRWRNDHTRPRAPSSSYVPTMRDLSQIFSIRLAPPHFSFCRFSVTEWPKVIPERLLTDKLQELGSHSRFRRSTTFRYGIPVPKKYTDH